MRNLTLVALLLVFAACAHGTEPHWLMDPPSHTLRDPGHDPKKDRPDSDCDPKKQADGTIQYQCVVHTFASYGALLKQIDRLETELQDAQSALKLCQQGKQ